MLKKKSLLLTFFAVLLLSSCSSKMKDMKQEFFTVTPEVPVEKNNLPVFPILIGLMIVLIGGIILVLKQKSMRAN